MRILLPGGFGFLGGRVALELAAHAGWTVCLGSRQLRPAPDWLPEVETVQLDIFGPESLARALQGVEVVVHLAAMNERECVADPARAIEVNILGAHNLLQAAVAAGVRRFIYVSTAHIYGAPLAGQITEQTVPRPVHPYAVTHRAAEDFVLAAHDQHKIEGVVVRLSNGFGRPVHPEADCWTLLVNDLCRQAVTTGKLVLRSNGLQRRVFIPLPEAARGVAHLIALPSEQLGDGLFNLGGESARSVWETTQLIAARCQAVLGFTPAIERVSPLPGDKSLPLEYIVTKLQATGFSLRARFEDEVDATLSLCQDVFGKS